MSVSCISPSSSDALSLIPMISAISSTWVLTANNIATSSKSAIPCSMWLCVFAPDEHVKLINNYCYHYCIRCRYKDCQPSNHLVVEPVKSKHLKFLFLVKSVAGYLIVSTNFLCCEIRTLFESVGCIIVIVINCICTKSTLSCYKVFFV